MFLNLALHHVVLNKPPAATVALTASATDAIDLTTYTFSTQALGTPSHGRYIIVGAGGNGSATGRTISSLTVGGVTATQLAFQEGANNGGTSAVAGLYIANVPSGTTGDIVITFSGAMLRACIGVWAVTNLLSANTTATTSSATDSPTVNISCLAGGIIVAATNNAQGTPSAATWTGLTEDYDATFDTFHSHTGASNAFAQAQSARAITVDPANASSSAALVVASFR